MLFICFFASICIFALFYKLNSMRSK